MTATVLEHSPATAGPAASAGRRRQPFTRILDAEWTKIRTVRSTVWTLATLVVASVGLTAAVCMAVAGEISSGVADEVPATFVTWGLLFGQIAALTLGILAATSEYSSGMIRSSFAAVPRRSAVIGAKAAVLAALLLVLGTLTTLASFLAGNFFMNQEGIGLSLDDPDVVRTIVGGGLYLAVLGVFGLALGFLIRHSAAAVTIGIALFFVVGGMVGLIPGAVGEWLNKLMPGNAGGAIAQVETFDPNLLEPWVGFAVFAGETTLLLAVATYLLSRRDA